jgi:poly(A) polymerase
MSPALQDDPPGPSRKRAAAETIVRMLHERGHVAYFAGGCVRDQIMGLEPTDYDVATDAPPEQVRRLFRRARLVGQAFGVVRACVDGVWIEVATFRTEWGYADHRRPDHVAYSDAQHDARRRDFTINGLFFDPLTGRVIDFVGGQDDILGRVVRAIGEPAHRFGEDYLRMLRAVRFAARLGFSIEPATARAIRQFAPHLTQISRERIGMEVQMMLEHPTRAEALSLMQQLELDAPVLDEPHSMRPPAASRALPRDDYSAALATWAIDRHIELEGPAPRSRLIDALTGIKSVALCRRWRAALMLSNEHRDAMRELLANLPHVLRWPELSTAQRKRLMARADWPALRAMLDAIVPLLDPQSLDRQALDREAAALQAQGVAPRPLVTGDDLIAAGLEPGPLFQTVLQKVYDAQLEGAVRTSDEAMKLARSLTHG